MITLIDIGNSRTKYCQVNTDDKKQISVIDNELLSSLFLTATFHATKKIVVASVSHNKLTDIIKVWCTDNNVSYLRVFSEAKKNKVVNSYAMPSKLGIDRWLTLVASASIYPDKNILIVDAGTATTFDLLAANGQHQGGWILAGISTLINSILTQTTNVKANEQEEPNLNFGTNTSENVHNAAWAATVGAVNSAITQAEEKGLKVDEVILTGGNGATLSSLLAHPTTTIEELVFTGLKAYI